MILSEDLKMKQAKSRVEPNVELVSKTTMMSKLETKSKFSKEQKLLEKYNCLVLSLTKEPKEFLTVLEKRLLISLVLK